jgi:chaperonin cofactor prefoldin
MGEEPTELEQQHQTTQAQVAAAEDQAAAGQERIDRAQEQVAAQVAADGAGRAAA